MTALHLRWPWLGRELLAAAHRGCPDCGFAGHIEHGVVAEGPIFLDGPEVAGRSVEKDLVSSYQSNGDIFSATFQSAV